MKTVIKSHDFTITQAMERFIQRKTRTMMSASQEQTERLVVRLRDINGPKGGQDKECSVEVTLPNFAPIVVKKRSSNAYASISQALKRASRITLRRIAKRRVAEQKGVKPKDLTLPSQATEQLNQA